MKAQYDYVRTTIHNDINRLFLSITIPKIMILGIVNFGNRLFSTIVFHSFSANHLYPSSSQMPVYPGIPAGLKQPPAYQ